MVATIDRLTSVPNGEVFGYPPVQGHVAYMAQSFKAVGSSLTSLEFLIDARELAFGGGTAFTYRVFVTTVEGEGSAIKPKTVLFTSAVQTEPIDTNHSLHHVTVNTGSLALTEGQTYAIIFDGTASAGQPTSGTPANVGATLGTSYDSGAGSNYLDGHVFYRANSEPIEIAAMGDWTDQTDEDLAFRLTFTSPGVTINGTRKNDKIDATHTVKGQPEPGDKDDTILGKKGNDKLSGLGGDDRIDGGKGNDKLRGGDGDDFLIGGKGKDTLFGEAGKDTFLFNASLKQAADRIKGFNPADDTIHLENAVFSVFTPGALPAGSLHIGNKAAADDDYLVYNPVNGALFYDSDAAGGNKGIKIATLDKNLSLTAADFAVV